MSISHTAQEVAQFPVIKNPSESLQPLQIKGCSQVRKKLRSTAQLLAHFLPETLPFFDVFNDAPCQPLGLYGFENVGTLLDIALAPTGRFRLPGTLTLSARSTSHGNTSVHVGYRRKTRPDHCR
ncbi:hypothetical protein DXT77_28780, partial [Pseudomonas sp. 91RF]